MNYKHRWFNRSVLLILALITVVSSFASCGKKSVFDGVESSKNDLKIVGKIGDYEVCYDELYYLICTCKDILKIKYGEKIFDTEESSEKYKEELNSMVLEKITANYAVLMLCDEYGIKEVLSDKKIVSRVNAEIDSLVFMYAKDNKIEVEIQEGKNGSVKYKYADKNGYEKAKKFMIEDLQKDHLTERVLRLTLGVEYAFENLVQVMTGEKNEIPYKDEDIEEYMFSDKFICTRHIFIKNDKGDDIEKNRILANQAYERYCNGESMDSLIGSKYNEDVSLTTKEGYYFTYGEMDENYEKASFALKEGEVSGVITTDKGFFIIERVKKTPSYMIANIDKFSQQIIYALANKKVRDFQSSISIELNNYGKSLEFSKIS